MAGNFANQDHDRQSFRTASRALCIAWREALPAATRAAASEAVNARLAEFLCARPPGRIAFCMPIRGEIDCRPLVQLLLARAWSACQPVVVAAATAMVFRPWSPDTPMTIDRHGIPIPAGAAVVEPDVILLPLVAFDDAGYRLGYGGGYFDRTLAALTRPCLTIGVGYEAARMDSIHPEAHDRPVDLIVTETGIRRHNHT